MTQWTTKAKQLLKQEQSDFEKEIKSNAPFILNMINEKRKQYKLRPWKRINKEVVEQTIIYLTENTVMGDIERKEKDYVASAIDYDECRGVYL